MKLIATFILALTLTVHGKEFFQIDSFSSSEPPFVVVHPPTSTSIYHDTSDALGGQRDVILKGQAPANSATIVSLVNRALSLAAPKDFVGSLVVQYDGFDNVTPFEGTELNIALGVGSAAAIPESNGAYVDFTSYGKANGVHVTIEADSQVQWVISALDSAGERNDYTMENDLTIGTTSHFLRYNDYSCEENINCWTNQNFDWTNVAAIQMQIVIVSGLSGGVDAAFSEFGVRGAEIPVRLTEVNACESEGSESKVEASKVEEAKVEGSKLEGFKVEESKVEEYKVEGSKVEESKGEESKEEEEESSPTPVIGEKISIYNADTPSIALESLTTNDGGKVFFYGNETGDYLVCTDKFSICGQPTSGNCVALSITEGEDVPLITLSGTRQTMRIRKRKGCNCGVIARKSE